MNILDQKLHIVTEEYCKLPWMGGKNGKYFRCYLCGHKFVPGDQFRWIYTNSTENAEGNPFVCKKCNDTNKRIIEKWQEMHFEWKVKIEKKFWWFARYMVIKE